MENNRKIKKGRKNWRLKSNLAKKRQTNKVPRWITFGTIAMMILIGEALVGKKESH
jgi:hypothetical protein